MNKENQIGNKDKLGILVPLGPYVVMSSHDHPKGEDPIIDLTAKKWDVWLTGQEEEISGEKYNFIIGPDGLFSPIAIRWVNIYPEIYLRKHDEMIKLETENSSAVFLNHQIGHRVVLISKHYPESSEDYTIIRLPLETLGRKLKIAQRYFSTGPRSTLISGMNNRDRLTQYLPFGRDLH
jgi:hypothetical protein